MTRKPKISSRDHHPSARSLDADEKLLWQQVTDTIKPIPKHQIKNNRAPLINKDQPINVKLRPIYELPRHGSDTEPKPYTHGGAPGLDKRTQLRLRRGQVKIESRVDLHGMTQTEAHHALIRFIESAYLNGRRSVLVITGKGLRPDGGVGVLRGAVPRWLNEAPLRNWVRAFDYASRRDGGEGALYVLVRRRK